MDGGGPKHQLCALRGARTRENTIINRVRSIPRAPKQKLSFVNHHLPIARDHGFSVFYAPQIGGCCSLFALRQRVFQSGICVCFMSLGVTWEIGFFFLRERFFFVRQRGKKNCFFFGVFGCFCCFLGVFLCFFFFFFFARQREKILVFFFRR